MPTPFDHLIKGDTQPVAEPSGNPFAHLIKPDAEPQQPTDAAGAYGPRTQQAPWWSEATTSLQNAALATGQLFANAPALAEQVSRNVLGVGQPEPGDISFINARQAIIDKQQEKRDIQNSYAPSKGLASIPGLVAGAAQYNPWTFPVAVAGDVQRIADTSQGRGDSALSTALQAAGGGLAESLAPGAVTLVSKIPGVRQVLGKTGAAAVNALTKSGLSQDAAAGTVGTAASALHGAGLGPTMTVADMARENLAGHPEAAPTWTDVAESALPFSVMGAAGHAVPALLQARRARMLAERGQAASVAEAGLPTQAAGPQYGAPTIQAAPEAVEPPASRTVDPAQLRAVAEAPRGADLALEQQKLAEVEAEAAPAPEPGALTPEGIAKINEQRAADLIAARDAQAQAEVLAKEQQAQAEAAANAPGRQLAPDSTPVEPQLAEKTLREQQVAEQLKADRQAEFDVGREAANLEQVQAQETQAEQDAPLQLVRSLRKNAPQAEERLTTAQERLKAAEQAASQAGFARDEATGKPIVPDLPLESAIREMGGIKRRGKNAGGEYDFEDHGLNIWGKKQPDAFGGRFVDGGVPADVMLQQLADAKLISEPTPGALDKALRADAKQKKANAAVHLELIKAGREHKAAEVQARKAKILRPEPVTVPANARTLAPGETGPEIGNTGAPIKGKEVTIRGRFGVPERPQGRLALGKPAQDVGVVPGVQRGPRPQERAQQLAGLTPEARKAAFDRLPAQEQAAVRPLIPEALRQQEAVKPPELPKVPQPTPEEAAARRSNEERAAQLAKEEAGQPTALEQRVQALEAKLAEREANKAAPEPVGMTIGKPGGTSGDEAAKAEKAVSKESPAPDVPAEAAAPRIALDAFMNQAAESLKGGTMTPERQREVLHATETVLHAAAEAAGQTTDDFVRSRLAGIESSDKTGKRGSTRFLADGRAVVRIMQTANESTVLHELGHVFRRYLKPEDLAKVEQRLGVLDGKWTTSNEEQFTKQWEAWHAKGEAPVSTNAPLNGVFAKFKNWLTSIYRGAKDSPLGAKISPGVEQVFKNIYTPGKGLQSEYRRAGDEGAVPAKTKTTTTKEEIASAQGTRKSSDAASGQEGLQGEEKSGVRLRDAEKNRVEAQPGEVSETGIKNEISAQDRERLGLPPRETPEGRSFDEMYDAGKAEAAKDSGAVYKLLDELRRNPNRALNDTEVGLLLKHKVDLENGLHTLLKLSDKAVSEGDANGVLIAEKSLDDHRAAMKEFIELSEQAGTATARGLVARKMMSDMDYSLSHMEAEAEAAKGAKLTPKDLTKVRDLYQSINDKNAAAEAYKNRLKKKIGEMEAKIEDKDYGPAQKRIKPAYDAETLRLQTELESVKSRWEAELRQYERSKRTVAQKVADAVAAAPGFAKSLKASLDDSAVFRQGWRVMFTNPVIWNRNAWKTFSDAWNTYGGKDVMAAVTAEMKLNPYYEQARQAKLAIGKAEEAFPTSLPEKVPVLGRIYKASENAFTAFQYRNRMQIFEKMMKTAKRSGVDITDQAQLRSIGKLVNSLTSRADLGKLEPAANVVNNVFFSARKLKADWDFITAHSGDTSLSAFARKQAFVNLAKVVAGTASILLIAKAVDKDSVDFDPRSANFGKIKVGNTRFDMTGGVAPLVTLGARLATSSTKSSTTGNVYPLNQTDKNGKAKFGSQTRADVVDQFFENKLSPVASVIWNRMRGQRFDGSKPTLATDAQDLLMPLAISNFIELQNDTGATPEKTAAGVVADFFGIGVNTYAPKKK